jgi:PIN domain nuclease of toxin-antitoxin system
MKRLLLDTHALIWWLNGDEQMGLITREEISNPENDIYVSAATTWEMSIKRQLGKLEAPDDIELKVEQAGLLKLSISLFHGEQAGLLPLHHRDPFDRVIIAQAQAEGLVIVTKDKYFPKYGVRLMNALQ